MWQCLHVSSSASGLDKFASFLIVNSKWLQYLSKASARLGDAAAPRCHKGCKRCKQCVSWTSLFIELYWRYLKIRLTLFPCFHLVSRTLKFSYQSIVFNYCTWKLGKILICWFITFWRELGVLAWLSSHPPRRPCRLKSGHTWLWDFSPFFSTSDGTFKNL